MEEFKLVAIKITQFGRNFYLTSIKCGQLLDEDAFRTDVWKEELKDSPEQQGYQRAPSKSHIDGVVKYIISDAIPVFPTSILLNSRKKIKARKIGSLYELIIDRALWIVDGQHRIYGIRKAIKEKHAEGWGDNPVPVVIMDEFSPTEELNQFKVINETQKGIPAQLLQWQMYQQIIRDPALKDKYEKKMWQIKALMVMNKLNDRDGSPWQGRIQLPNVARRPRHSINQNSFVTSLKPLFKDGFLTNFQLDDSYLILKNYWEAISRLFPEAMMDTKHYLILKTPGIFPLHMLANKALPRCNKDFSIANILRYLKAAFKGQQYSSDEFWAKEGDGAALLGSMKGFKKLGDELISNLPEETIKK